MKKLFLIPLLFVGCANVSTTKFSYNDMSGASVVIEMPKELMATNFTVQIDAKNGTALITADSIQTLNTETIKAQSEREKSVSGAISKGISEGAVEGAIKSFVPIP